MSKVKKIMSNLIQIPARICNKISFTAIVFNSNVDKKAAISGRTRLYDSKIEEYSYLGRNNLVINTQIGKFCSIADDCKIGCASHAIDWASTSPVFSKGNNILKKNFSNFEYVTNKRTIIGNDVWIGNNVLIKDGVKIGDGSIIGMGSVVTKDVEPYSIVAGVPARIIRYRFEKDVIDELLDLEWWNMSDDNIENVSKNIKNINKFISEVKKIKND